MLCVIYFYYTLNFKKQQTKNKKKQNEKNRKKTIDETTKKSIIIVEVNK
ncbi:TPA: hypothetical protein ACGOVD_001728 [Streptococcus suis]